MRGAICFADSNPPFAVELKKFIAQTTFADPGLTDHTDHITLAIQGSLKGPGTVLLAAPLAVWTIPIFDVTI